MLALSLALGLDAFSVAIGAGIVAPGLRRRLRLAWHFGFFQFGMPLLGWQLASVVSPRVGASSKWLGAFLLFLIGARMIRASFRPTASLKGRLSGDPTKGWMLVGLSLATSLDALGAGFGFGLLISDLLPACLLIGAVAFVVTYTGMAMGNRLAGRVGTWAEAVGGTVLVLLGVRMILF